MPGKRGILLFSGGLDSLLAARLLLDQGVELIGLHFLLPFTPPDIGTGELKASQRASLIGLPLTFYRCDREYMELVRDPPHGYGKNMNPCIDCKVYFLKKAGELMREMDASFVATGEVVGQRPMSQMKHMLNHIEKSSGLRGFLLRPLSAKLLEPTQAETDGIVNRDALLNISGRSRRIQLELAARYNISEYSSPAGGCLLTDSNMSKRLRDLFAYIPDYTMIDVYLLTVGRHIRINESLKIIVSRNESENIELEKYREIADLFIIPDFKGPSIFARGVIDEDDIDFIGSIMLRYRNRLDRNNRIVIYRRSEEPRTMPVQKPVSDDVLKPIMI
jgi:tRNA-specific 2-thiouridylase